MMSSHKGQVVDTSSSGGLGVREAWFLLFERNEAAWSKGECAKILTDEQLVAQMKKWFPKRKKLLTTGPRRMRGFYNRKKGVVASYRYLKSKGRVCRATSRGLPASDWKA